MKTMIADGKEHPIRYCSKLLHPSHNFYKYPLFCNHTIFYSKEFCPLKGYLLSSRWNTLEVSFMCASYNVANCDFILLCHNVYHVMMKIGKCIRSYREDLFASILIQWRQS
jgi:hypothetical protein